MQKKYSFPVEKAVRLHRENGCESWAFAVQARNLPAEFKLDPNARNPDPEAASVKAMLETLRDAPEEFWKKNNGILLIAARCAPYDGGSGMVLTCDEAEHYDLGGKSAVGHGIVNGGHTYHALLKALADPKTYPRAHEAWVRCDVQTGIGFEEIPGISQARNTSERVKPYALRALKGDWSDIEKHVPGHSLALVEFKPGGDAKKYDTTDLLRLLSLINNQKFPAPDKHPKKAYTNLGSLIKEYTPEDYSKVVHLLPDVIHLEELVARTYEALNGTSNKFKAVNGTKKTNKDPLLSGYQPSFMLPAVFFLPVIAAFRVFIKNGKWVRPVDELWEKFGRDVIRRLYDDYLSRGNSDAHLFGRDEATWSNACLKLQNAGLLSGVLKPRGH